MFLSSFGRRAMLASSPRFGFSVSNESTFLEMVSQYFDKAGEATGISKDRLEFLKKPDYSLKFNIPFKTGIFWLKQTLVLSKLSKPIVFSTKPTNFPLKEEQDTLAASIFKKLKLFLVL